MNETGEVSASKSGLALFAGLLPRLTKECRHRRRHLPRNLLQRGDLRNLECSCHSREHTRRGIRLCARLVGVSRSRGTLPTSHHLQMRAVVLRLPLVRRRPSRPSLAPVEVRALRSGMSETVREHADNRTRCHLPAGSLALPPNRRDRHDARDERNESLCTARRISGRHRSTTPVAGPPKTNAEPMPVIDRFVLL